MFDYPGALPFELFVVGNALRMPRDQRAHSRDISTQTLRDLLELVTQPPDQDVTDQRSMP
jgi:hypothetical protein